MKIKEEKKKIRDITRASHRGEIIQLYLSPKLKMLFKKRAYTQDKSMSSILRDFIRGYVKGQKGGGNG